MMNKIKKLFKQIIRPKTTAYFSAEEVKEEMKPRTNPNQPEQYTMVVSNPDREYITEFQVWGRYPEPGEIETDHISGHKYKIYYRRGNRVFAELIN